MTRESNYFHASRREYEPGAIIYPGNWGKAYHSYDPGRLTDAASWLMLARELLMEKVRQELFPDKPSRFESAFICPTAGYLDQYLNSYNLNKRRYLVELVEPAKPSHVGDYTLCHWRQGMSYLHMSDTSIRYWSGEIDFGREIVTSSALRVLKLLE